ncbi:MAG: D-tyrosyl-tRNA(Tyr) deacylase [Dehalococcoidia bacterium]|nr:MAG: D-tyrosyl-tRNA(Tyr) deacylase [Dehalococcoidia bacterium]
MRAVLQRVLRARVTVDGFPTGAIEGGLLVYLGIAPGDGEPEVEWFARKVSEMRIFEGAGDREGQMDRSVIEAGGAVLVVSQFTLYADTRKGRRPAFTDAAPPEVAAPLVDRCMEALRTRGLRVEGGRFGAHMLVDAVNDGPVTILLDSEEMGRPRRS